MEKMVFILKQHGLFADLFLYLALINYNDSYLLKCHLTSFCFL